jgi:hypothetical protein
MKVISRIGIDGGIAELGPADVKVVLFPELIKQFSECDHVLCAHLKGPCNSGTCKDIICRHVVGHVDGEPGNSSKRRGLR